MSLQYRVVPMVFMVVALLGIFGSIVLFAQGEQGYVGSEGLYLPIGDPEQGREAFKTLKCFTCHRVESDPSLPQPVTKPAPVLIRTGMVHNPGDFADAILSPQHKIVVDSGGEIEGGLSRMGDFADSMTVRQFVDIIAYLMYEEEW